MDRELKYCKLKYVKGKQKLGGYSSMNSVVSLIKSNENIVSAPARIRFVNMCSSAIFSLCAKTKYRIQVNKIESVIVKTDKIMIRLVLFI